MASPETPLGLIAGGGELPIATARGMKAAGRRVVCVGLRGCYDPILKEICDDFHECGIIQVGRWCKRLRSWCVEDAVMVGKVEKTRMYDPFRMFRELPDWAIFRIWFFKLRHDRRPDAVLGAVADWLNDQGVRLIDSTTYIPENLADEGVMTRRKPTESQIKDIRFALPLVWQMGALDVGQSVAVCELETIAVEAIEGTDRMLQRVGELCKLPKWVLVKMAKPNQDMRFDVPTIGPATVERMKECGGRCIAIEAEKTIMLDKQATIQKADEAGIAIVGLRLGADGELLTDL